MPVTPDTNTPAPPAEAEGLEMPGGDAAVTTTQAGQADAKPEVTGGDDAAGPGAETAGDSGGTTDEKEAIRKYAESINIAPEHFSQFETLDQARSAVAGLADHMARQGMLHMNGQRGVRGNAQDDTPKKEEQPRALPPSSTPEGAAIDLQSLGLDEDEPAARAIQALYQQVHKQDKQLQELTKEREQSRQQARQKLQEQADEIVDSFNAPEFGSMANQTGFQAMERERLYQMANRIAAGYMASGHPPPSLEARLTIAKEQYYRHYPPRAAPPAPENPGQSQGSANHGNAAPTALPSRSPSAAPANEGPGLLGRWSQDPEVRAKLGI